MAGDNDFSFKIGIDTSDFDNGLKETQRKLTAAMAQFEREKSLVKIRADIDIAGLDETTDKTKILAIQEKALTDTLELQRQKLQAASEAYELTAKSQGIHAASTQKLELAMEKERLKVVQLEKDFEKLKQSAVNVDTTVKVNVDDSEIDNLKIDAPKVEIKADVDTSRVEAGISKAEQSIKSKIDRLSREQTLIQLRGQVKLEGLDEAADDTEKLKLQEEALTEQINLQQEKISLLSNAYENLARSQGANSDAAQIAAIQLEKEQLAMTRLQQQTEDLSKQTEIAIGVEWELLGLIEPALKGIDALIAAGRTIPVPHAKAAAAAAIALSAVAVGSKEATDELRENNPAQILSDSFEELDFSDVENDIAESFAEITENASYTSNEIEKTFEESAENVSSDLETMADSYADYFDDALSIIQILVSDTENLGDSLEVVNSQLPYMKTETGRIAAIALGLYKTFDELSKEVIDFSQTAVDGFQEVKKQANELYLSLSKAQEIGSLIDLAGGDYDDVRDYVRGVQDAVIKGASDDPEVLAMERYGVVIQDTKGKLLEFDEALENLYQGYLKAKEAGEAEAYIIMTNGQSIHDVAGFLENYGKAKERANQIKWSTSDFESLNELAATLKMAEVQTNEFNNALSTLGVPLANLAAESNFEFFKMATEIIEENRDTILLWEFAAIEAFKNGKQAVIDFADSTIQEIKELNETFGISDKLQGFISGVDESLGLTEKLENLLSASDNKSDNQESIFDKAKKDLEEYNAANEKAREETKKSKKDASGLSYSLNRIAKLKEEIADIKIDLQFGDDEYQKSLAKLEQWRETALKDARQYEEEQAVIAEEYALKRELIELQHFEEIEKQRQESAERAKAFLQEAADTEYEMTHSAFEKQLYDIQKWQAAQLEKATTAEESAAIIANAIAKENAAIKAETDSIKENINALISEASKIEFENTHSAFEKQLRDIEQWKQTQLEKARTAEEVAATIENAAMKEADAFEREMDRIRGKIESAQDRLARLTLSQYENDIYQAQKQYYQDVQDLPKKIADAIYNASLAAAEKRKREDKNGNYTKRPNSPNTGEDFGQLIDFSNFNKQVDSAAENLIKLDVEELARMEMLRKAGNSISEIDYSLSKANISAQAFAKINSETEYANKQLTQSLQNTTDTTQNLGDTVDIADSAVSKNTSAIKDATSAAGTFAKGLERFAGIEANKKARDNFTLPEKAPDNTKFKVIYGDEPQKEYKGINILYGDAPEFNVTKDKKDVPDLYSKFAQLGNATDNLITNINSVDLENLKDSADKAAQNLVNIETDNITENIQDHSKELTEVTSTTITFNDALKLAAESSGNVATAFEDAAKIISENSEKLSLPNPTNNPAEVQPAAPNKSGDIVDKALDATKTFGNITNLLGTLMTGATLVGGPASVAIKGLQLALTGMGIDIMADIAQQVRNFDDSIKPAPATNVPAVNSEIDAAIEKLNQAQSQQASDIMKELQEINRQLLTLETAEKTLETIAQDLKSFDTPKNETPDSLPQYDFSQIENDVKEINQETKNITRGVEALKNIPAFNVTAELPKDNSDFAPVSTQGITDAQIAKLENALDFSPLQTSFDSFNSELDGSRLIISEFSFALKDSADKINNLSFDLPDLDLENIIKNFGGDAFNNMTQELLSLTKTAGDIAQNVSAIQQQKPQPPNITVSPNISIDLGGAYVFDNQLKSQLTDDIVSEVANAVKSAVETATTQANYGYGN